jgi:hypothetical protein
LLATRYASLADACFELPAPCVAADFCALFCAAGAYDWGLRFLTLSPQCDLVDNREVSNVEGRDLAKSFGVPFFESSAKSRINVEEAFYELVGCAVFVAWLRYVRPSCRAYIVVAFSIRSEKSAVRQF